jgi:hypothetical protein
MEAQAKTDIRVADQVIANLGILDEELSPQSIMERASTEVGEVNLSYMRRLHDFGGHASWTFAFRVLTEHTVGGQSYRAIADALGLSDTYVGRCGRLAREHSHYSAETLPPWSETYRQFNERPEPIQGQVEPAGEQPPQQPAVPQQRQATDPQPRESKAAKLAMRLEDEVLTVKKHVEAAKRTDMTKGERDVVISKIALMRDNCTRWLRDLRDESERQKPHSRPADKGSGKS